jgi:hypothetical protein
VDDTDRYRLLGTYRTPRFRLDSRVFCWVRGEVTVCGMTDAPIPWPIGKCRQGRSLVVYKDLARAVLQESNLAVCHWWGITPQTVTKRRKALGVPETNTGTSRLRSEYMNEPWAEGMRTKARAKDRDPERCAKIAAARRGKPRPPHVIQAMTEARLGSHHTDEAKAKTSATHRQWGTLVPGTRVWTSEEDQMALTLPAAEVAQRTGRSLAAVYIRQSALRRQRR